MHQIEWESEYEVRFHTLILILFGAFAEVAYIKTSFWAPTGAIAWSSATSKLEFWLMINEIMQLFQKTKFKHQILV